MTVPVLPESAPFTPSQRAWLNGFFAGLFGVDPGGMPVLAPQHAPAPVAPMTPPAAPAEEFPWHDPALPMEERLHLADGQPRARVLMAAMAQLDCGACGYVCKTYSEALASGAETCVSLCSPGGAATAKKLKELLRTPPSGKPERAAPKLEAAGPLKAAWDRKNPFAARLVKAARLTSPASEKDTRHVVLDLEGSGIAYEPGDSLGVWPENCHDLVEAVMRKISATGEEPVAVPSGGERPLRDALLRHYALNCARDELLEAVGVNDERSTEEPSLDVLDALELRHARAPSPPELVQLLSPLAPRLYSISSSLKAHPDEVHLTVSVVRYALRGRERKGVASTFLGERAKPGHRVHVFVQRAHGFRLPRDPGAPIIMIGPGTGIAPFRAFLEERKAAGAKGRSWLFFGEQRRECDFLYRDELEGFQRDGYLTRLDVAFSRDQADKVYVQHRLRAAAAEVWRWIRDGAVVYVCGDAKRMALDVDQALREIASSEAGLDDDAARAFFLELARTGRYLRDVY